MGIMLMNVQALELVLDFAHKNSKSNFVSSTWIKTEVWEKRGNLELIFPPSKESPFMPVPWDELKDVRFATMSYRWDADWVALARCLLEKQKKKKDFPQWIWIDIFCIDQESEDKMGTIKNSHKIYTASSSYNLALCDGYELGRSWILFELAATLRREAERDEESDDDDEDNFDFDVLYPMSNSFVSQLQQKAETYTFESSQCTVKKDKETIRRFIEKELGSIEEFNEGLFEFIRNGLKL